MFKQTNIAVGALCCSVIYLLSACHTSRKLVDNYGVTVGDSVIYRQALNTAQDFNQLKVSHNLTEVTPSNNAIATQNKDTFKVLVVAWKDSADLKYYNYGKPGYFNTGRFINFVTVVPD